LTERKYAGGLHYLIPRASVSQLTFKSNYRISTTPTADFLIAPHPRISGIHLATGGSAHAWKFLPIIGDHVVDSIEGSLPQELVEKWAFQRFSGGKDQNAPRMDGEPQELRDFVRHVL
jgi:sarcosine oxidase/L-pipecolate oxidase